MHYFTISYKKNLFSQIYLDLQQSKEIWQMKHSSIYTYGSDIYISICF